MRDIPAPESLPVALLEHQPSRAIRDPAGIFPLPLATFERYMICDDRQDYPMAFALVVETEGTPDRIPLERAYEAALLRHPLLRAQLTSHSASGQWIPSQTPAALCWDDAGPAAPPLRRGRIDLTRRPGVETDIACDGNHTRMTFRFHHAACDGIGGLRFISDLLACYAAEVSVANRPAELHPLDPGLLRERSEFDLTYPGPVSTRDVLLATFRSSWETLTVRPSVVAGEQQRPAAFHDGIPVLHLSGRLREALRARADELGVTTNDLLLRDMFITLREWNARHTGQPRGWLRIGMPTSLRGQRDERMPAANLVGYGMVTRHVGQCEDPADLLVSLNQETELIKDWSYGAVFVNALRMVEKVPGLLPMMLSVSQKFATIILSNIGNPLHHFSAELDRDGQEVVARNLQVKAIYGAPPIRPGTRMAMMVSSYAGRLSLALNADPRWFSPEQVEEFLDHYRARLETSASCRPSA